MNFDIYLNYKIKDFVYGEPKQNYKKVIIQMNYIFAVKILHQVLYSNDNIFLVSNYDNIEILKHAYIARDIYMSNFDETKLKDSLSFNFNKLKRFFCISFEKENKMLDAINGNNIYKFYEQLNHVAFFDVIGW